MITAEKIAETQKKIKNGYPVGEIREQLRKEGYSEEDIRSCFKVHRYDMRLWYLLSAVLLLIWGTWSLLISQGLLPLILSPLMFWIYSREKKRIDHQNKQSN